MTVSHDDLRLTLGFRLEDWDTHDQLVAESVIARCVRQVRGMAGSKRVDRAIANNDEDLIAAVDEATMVLAVARFSNPEGWLQARQGSDRSVSFGDSSDAANGRKEAEDIISEAFGTRMGTTTL